MAWFLLFMSSKKRLRKYLAYYRKTLSEDPGNIEARLRLAALFQEMGRPGHAIEEYGTAAKLLASEGLPLEAIAACKAILELDSSHQQTQFFLAKLYARVPEATGDSVRVARPVEPDKSETAQGGFSPVSPPANRTQSPQVHELDAESEEGLDEARKAAITLDSPKVSRSVIADNESSDAPSPETVASTVGGDAEDSPRRRERDPNEFGWHKGTHVQHLDDEEDRQTFELDVFDIDSLELERGNSTDWESLDFLDEVDEPDTVEMEIDEQEALTAAGTPGGGVQREFRVSALPRIPLFSQLPRRVFVEILDAMELEKLPASTEILRSDDPVSCLYVIVSGKVRVEKDLMNGQTVELAVLGEGQIFGEFRLLTGKGGRARVVAMTDVELLAVQDEVLYEVGRDYPKMWQVLWSFYYRRMLNHAMASSRLFRMLNQEERDLVCRHFDRSEITAGEVLFERGDPVDALSVVVRGSLRVSVPSGESDREVETLEEGAFVGVSPCSREVPATATVRARTDVVVYQMAGTIFRELLYGLPDVAEAVRELVRERQSRTRQLSDDSPVSDWV